MKNKKLQLILIPLVLLLWGAIGYRIYTGLIPEEIVFKPVPPSLDLQGDTSKQFVYEPMLNYSDPFLKGKQRTLTSSNRSTTAAQSTSGVKKSKTAVKKKVVDRPVRWPALAYKGQLEKSKSGQPMCILEVEKQLHFLRKGEGVGAVVLKEVYTDSLVVEYQSKALKTLYKQ